MFILKVNHKAVLRDILNGNPSGIVRDFVCNDNPTNRLEELVYYAYNEQIKNSKVFIEVKFASKYSSREKRLELVTIKDDVISIFKVSASNRFDKDAIELKRIIDEVNEEVKSNYHIRGVLKIKPSSDVERIKKMLESMNIDIMVE
ncbi:MAG: hypothetical protein ACOX4D_02195 [Bacteroidales bacterium]|jgi:hypothetical protein